MRPSGHAGPGLATPGAQCLGVHHFRLAFEPRGPAPSNAELFGHAGSFATPPYVVSAIGAGGALPPVGQFVSLDPLEGGLVLSACHKATTEEAMLLRLFNPNGEVARIRVASQRPIRSASRTDFLERPLDEIPVMDGTVELTAAPYQIVTAILRERVTVTSYKLRRAWRRRSAHLATVTTLAAAFTSATVIVAPVSRARVAAMPIRKASMPSSIVTGGSRPCCTF